MKGLIGMYGEYYLIMTDGITKRVPRRPHRKRRIRKKWLKRYGYKDVLDDSNVLIMGDKIFATPKTAKKLIEHLKEKGLWHSTQ